MCIYDQMIYGWSVCAARADAFPLLAFVAASYLCF